MAAPKDNAPFIWTDYGKPVKGNALVFAQPPSSPPDANNVTTIKLWFFTTDPGSGPALPDPKIKKGPDETIFINWHADARLRVYPFVHARLGQYVLMQLVGRGASVGGSELRLISQ